MATTSLEPWTERIDPRVVAALRQLARVVAAVHPVRLDGVEHLPAGPALLVGNHGLLGYETLLFFDSVLSRTGRMPLGLADRWFFRVPGLRELLVRAGGMLGTAENARRALGRGDWVVAYPGGAREVLKRANRFKHRLLWAESRGFARLATELQIPIVPFAAAGVDDTYDILASIRGSGRLLMRHSKYDLPVLWGLGPFPRPVPFWFRFGSPIMPCARDSIPSADNIVDDTSELHSRAWTSAQSLLDELTREWDDSRRATAA